MALWDFALEGHIWWSLIRQICDSLQYQDRDVGTKFWLENAIAAPLRRFDLIVQAFHEAATKTSCKVIDDFVEPIIERYQECIKAR